MNALKRWRSDTSTKTAATASSVDSGDDEDANAGPVASSSNAASTAAPSGPSPSAGSPDKLRLSLLQPSSIINPGSTIQGHVDVASLKDCKSLHVILSGKCACTIMGKMRFQAALGVNSLGGAGYGGAAPITFRESHSFLNNDKTIWSADDPASASKAESQHNSAKKDSTTSSNFEKQRFEFSLDVPRIKQCTCPAVTYALPPSVDLRHFDPSMGAIDTSTIEVKYSISAVLDRKGLLRRKQK